MKVTALDAKAKICQLQGMTFDRFLLSTGYLWLLCKQYRDMARGGNGGIITGSHKKYRQFARESFFEHPLGIRWDDEVPENIVTTTRQHYYPNHPISFFQKVCDGMGWSY